MDSHSYGSMFLSGTLAKQIYSAVMIPEGSHLCRNK